MSEQLPDATTMGCVALTVPDLARSVTFYRERIGLHLQEQADGVATLGAGDVPLLRLYGESGARRPAGPAPGLYHFAILFPDRATLARALHHLAQTETSLQGFADHYVSEAIYLADPDGNGIELYRDRPRAEWPFRGGQLQMGTAALDIDDLLNELREGTPTWTGLPAGTTIGHVHLQVSRLPEAERFYREVVGFDLMLHYGSSAAFLSAGGYHHHLGLNTWHSAGAPPPSADAAGLRWYEIVIPEDAVDPLLARARTAGVEPVQENGAWVLSDPSHNRIRLATSA